MARLLPQGWAPRKGKKLQTGYRQIAARLLVVRWCRAGSQGRPASSGVSVVQQPREQRLAAKLRENLKRRKQQARARAAGAPATGDNPRTDTDGPDDGGGEAAPGPGRPSES